MMTTRHFAARFLVCAMAAAACLVLASCKDDNIASQDETPATKAESGTYTIMFYANASGQLGLDDAIAHYLTQAIYHGATDKVNMTVEVKFSTAKNLTNLTGVERFDLADQADLKDSNDMPHTYDDFGKEDATEYSRPRHCRSLTRTSRSSTSMPTPRCL